MTDDHRLAGRPIGDLIDIMACLRDPQTGCRWDVAQTFATIAPYTLEEAHEVADAIARGDRDDLCEELGDLLLQVVFHARMAEEEGSFAFPDVVAAICAKMIRRHPHVFLPDGSPLPPQAERPDPAATKGLWQAIKAEEKAEKAARRAARGLPPEEKGGVLSGVPGSLPALQQAGMLSTKAAAVGFDWADWRQVLDKVREETAELEAELAAAPEARDRDRIEGELGDLLFSVANLARHLDIEPESALRRTNRKFVRRFSQVEARLAEAGRTPAEASLDEMEAHWQAAKSVAP